MAGQSTPRQETAPMKCGKKLTAATSRKSGDANARHSIVWNGSPDRLGNLGGKNRKYGQQRSKVGVLESN